MPDRVTKYNGLKILQDVVEEISELIRNEYTPEASKGSPAELTRSMALAGKILWVFDAHGGRLPNV